MVDRIKAAADAKTDPEFVIMARTDALAVEGLEAAIERACACVEAGADMIFPEAITELAMYRKFADAVKVPILANITEFGKTPLFTHAGARERERRDGALSAVGVARGECRGAQGLSGDPQGRPPEERRRAHADRATISTTTSTTTPTSRSSTRCSRGTRAVSRRNSSRDRRNARLNRCSAAYNARAAYNPDCVFRFT